MFGLGKTGGKSWLGAGFFAAMVALALSLASPARAQDTRLPVGASFSILADIVKVVGGGYFGHRRWMHSRAHRVRDR